MRRSCFQGFWFVALALGPGLAGAADPQESLRASTAKAALEAPPLPPAPKSPIAFFRELLGGSGADRDKLLEGKSPEHRQVIARSLQVYDALAGDEREVRLRTMELRYYFNSAIRGPATNRSERVKSLPDLYRQAVTDRLVYWDKLAADVQQQLLDHERLLRVTGARTNIAVTGLSSNLMSWQSLPGPRRRQVEESFARIFEMTEAERAAAMEAAARQFTPAEREQMEQAMAKFRALPRDQRDRAISGFQRFSMLSPEERRQFLRNAEVWERMTPAERQKWRDLVSKLPPMPPMPPGFNATPMPPIPPFPLPVAPATALATNR